MRIDIPKIVRPVALKDYAEELGEAVVQVWVNPTRAVLDEWNELLALAKTEPEATETKFADWWSRMWSQGADEAGRISAADVMQLARLETDPGFFRWLTVHSWRLVNEHRSAAKKN